MATTTPVFLSAGLRLEAPRGALWAAAGAVALYRLFERIGARKAEKLLLALADRQHSIDPERAGALRDAAAHCRTASAT